MQSHTDGKFRPLDYLRALRDTEMSSAQFAIMAALLSFAAGEDNKDGKEPGTCFPGQDTIAKAAKVSRCTVMRELPILRDHGWFTSSRRSRTAHTHYKLAIGRPIPYGPET
jgi:hypothetical protein